MRFLVDADLPRRTSQVIRRRGHTAIDVRDIGLGSAKDADIAEHAQCERLCLLTADFDFADIRNYPPASYAGIVVLDPPRDATAEAIADLLDRFLSADELVRGIPGRLAIVQPGRIRMR